MTQLPTPITQPKPKFFKTKGHLMLCQNSTCQSRGGGILHSVLVPTLEQRHLMYYTSNGTLRYTTSGCLGACSYGPILACYRQTPHGLEQAWYAGVTLPLALEVALAVQNDLPLPSQGRFDLNQPTQEGS
jgi:(2Fe-2S) ferredoxin